MPDFATSPVNAAVDALPHARWAKDAARASRVASVVLAALVAGCGADERESFLVSALLDDNQDMLRRDPTLLADKLAAMSEDPFRFARGSLGVFIRDAIDPGSPLAWPSSVAAPDILLVGDPHLENLGTCGVELAVDYNDFDAARFGPSTLDVRRLGATTAVAAGLIAPDDQSLAGEMVRAMAQAYVDALVHGLSTSGGAAVASLRERAHKDGVGRDELEAPVERSAPSVAEERAVGAALRDAGIGDVVELLRVYGRGVASVPLLRFRARLAGATSAPHDDIILDVKEARDPARLPDLFSNGPRNFATNAERIVAAQRQLQGHACDPWLSFGGDAPGFRVASDTGFMKGLRVERLHDNLAAGDLDRGGVIEVARLAGARLGEAHGRGGTDDGGDARAALIAALADDDGALVDETEQHALHHSLRITDDFDIFRRALQERGPVLGARFVAGPR